MANGKPISGLPEATFPLTGSEITVLVQNGITAQAPVSSFFGSPVIYMTTAALITGPALIGQTTGFKAVYANASTGVPAMGVALTSALLGASLPVYLFGNYGGFSGLTIGPVFALPGTPGGLTQTIPSTTGNYVQMVGYATSSTTINFVFGQMNGPL